VDVEHASPLSWYGGQAFEPPGMLHDSQSDRIPTMFRDQTRAQVGQHCWRGEQKWLSRPIMQRRSDDRRLSSRLQSINFRLLSD